MRTISRQPRLIPQVLFLTFITMLFATQVGAQEAAQSQTSSSLPDAGAAQAELAYLNLLNAWTEQDAQVQASEISLKLADIAFQRYFGESLPGWETGIQSSTNDDGSSILLDSSTGLYDYSLEPYFTFTAGDDDPLEIHLETLLEDDGDGGASYTPALRLSKTFSDVFGADTADTQGLNLELARISAAQTVAAAQWESEKDLVERLSSLYSLDTQIFSNNYEQWMLDMEAADALNVGGYRENSLYVRDLRNQIAALSIENLYLEAQLETQLESLRRISGIALQREDISVLALAIAPRIPRTISIPELAQVTDYRLAEQDLRSAASELEDANEDDELAVGFYATYQAVFESGSLDSSTILGGLELAYGDRISGDVAMGMRDSDGSPIVELSIQYSSDRDAADTLLEINRLELELSNALLSLDETAGEVEENLAQYAGRQQYLAQLGEYLAERIAILGEEKLEMDARSVRGMADRTTLEAISYELDSAVRQANANALDQYLLYLEIQILSWNEDALGATP